MKQQWPEALILMLAISRCLFFTVISVMSEEKTAWALTKSSVKLSYTHDQLPFLNAKLYNYSSLMSFQNKYLHQQKLSLNIILKSSPASKVYSYASDCSNRLYLLYSELPEPSSLSNCTILFYFPELNINIGYLTVTSKLVLLILLVVIHLDLIESGSSIVGPVIFCKILPMNILRSVYFCLGQFAQLSLCPH